MCLASWGCETSALAPYKHRNFRKFYFSGVSQKKKNGWGRGGAAIIVSDCIVESSPRSEMCVDQHGRVPRPLPTISHLIHLS